jgi:hypothetical protein
MKRPKEIEGYEIPLHAALTARADGWCSSNFRDPQRDALAGHRDGVALVVARLSRRTRAAHRRGGDEQERSALV